MLPQYTPPAIKFGFCHCGCGEKTRIATGNDRTRGFIKDQPLRFIVGHNGRLQEFRTTAEAFWEKVKILSSDECWLWQGRVNEDGYGTATYLGKPYKSHRLSWILTNGEIDEESIQVLHRCDNPPCCNFHHLFLGTHADNMKDMARKGRGTKRCGEDVHLSKLKEEDIFTILELHEAQEMTQTAIAQLYNVSQPAIGYIVRGETWKHIKQEYDRRKRE